MILRKTFNRSLTVVCLVAFSLVFVTESRACHYLRWCRYQHLKAYFEAYGGGTSSGTGTAGTTVTAGTSTVKSGVAGNAEAIAAAEQKAAAAKKAKAAEELKKAKDEETEKNTAAEAAEKKAQAAAAALAASPSDAGLQAAADQAKKEAKAAREAADKAKEAREALEKKGDDNSGGIAGARPEAGVEPHFFIGLGTSDQAWRLNIDGLGQSIQKLKGLNEIHAEVTRLRSDVEVVRQETEANGRMLQEVLQLLRAPQAPVVPVPIDGGAELAPPATEPVAPELPTPAAPQPEVSTPDAG